MSYYVEQKNLECVGMIVAALKCCGFPLSDHTLNLGLDCLLRTGTEFLLSKKKSNWKQFKAGWYTDACILFGVSSPLLHMCAESKALACAASSTHSNSTSGSNNRSDDGKSPAADALPSGREGRTRAQFINPVDSFVVVAQTMREVEVASQQLISGELVVPATATRR